MAHGIDPEIDVARPERERLDLGVERGGPVAVGQHGTLGSSGRPGRVLDVTEVVEAAVSRAHPGG